VRCEFGYAPRVSTVLQHHLGGAAARCTKRPYRLRFRGGSYMDKNPRRYEVNIPVEIEIGNPSSF